MLQNNILRTGGEAGRLQRYTFRSTTVQALVKITAPVYAEVGDATAWSACEFGRRHRPCHDGAG
jgi:hypothetical protein